MNLTFVAFALIAVIIAAYGFWRDSQQKDYLQEHGIRTSGIVIHNKFCFGRICVFRPIIQFQTQQGRTIEALDQHGPAMAIPRFSKGTKVMLVYEEENLTIFRVLSEGNIFP